RGAIRGTPVSGRRPSGQSTKVSGGPNVRGARATGQATAATAAVASLRPLAALTCPTAQPARGRARRARFSRNVSGSAAAGGGVRAPEVARLIDAHAAPLVLYARQWCDAPEDVVQEAFLKLVRLGQPPQDAAAWLYRVVRNGALDAAKTARRR